MKYVLIATLCVFFFIGCKKETPDAPASANTELLTSKAWLYDEYYTGYNTAAKKRVYKRNAPGNSADFSVYQYIFKKDGSFEVKIGTESTFSSWKFVENETVIEITGGAGSVTRLKVMELNPATFDWMMDDYYAKMIPQK
jgi:hypothetical protein